jgi:bidirectional [NiFe] hydrogenase diaphorase subunit
MDLADLLEIAETQRTKQKPTRVHCCTSTGCRAARSLEVLHNLKSATEAAGLQDQVEVVGVGCNGFCGRGPLVEIDPKNVLYEEVKPEDAASIIDTLKGGTATATQGDLNHPFFFSPTQDSSATQR